MTWSALPLKGRFQRARNRRKLRAGDQTDRYTRRVMLFSTKSRSLVALLFVVPFAVGCGSSQAKPAADATTEPGETAGEDAAPEAPESEPEPEGPSLSRPAQDIISEPDNAWVFNFQSSENYEKAGEQCDGRFKDKPKERAACMSKARSAYVADAMEFKKNAAGQSVWVVYRAKGNRLIQIYSVPVSYGDEKAGVLQVKKAGNGKGSPPLFGSAGEFEVKLLSNYTMELNDSRHGRVTYDARIGFISK